MKRNILTLCVLLVALIATIPNGLVAYASAENAAVTDGPEANEVVLAACAWAPVDADHLIELVDTKWESSGEREHRTPSILTCTNAAMLQTSGENADETHDHSIPHNGSCLQKIQLKNGLWTY